MKTLALSLAILSAIPGTVLAQAPAAAADIPCDKEDNACLLRKTLYQARQLEQERQTREHLKKALAARTDEANKWHEAADKAAEQGHGHVNVWVGVGFLGGATTVLLLAYIVSHTLQQ